MTNEQEWSILVQLRRLEMVSYNEGFFCDRPDVEYPEGFSEEYTSDSVMERIKSILEAP